jgi:glycosyltransferase involved in cell wall biosynthesis
MEYLAMGRPVVATDLPDIRAVGDVVYCTKGVEGFIKAVESALKDGDPALKELRREVAKTNSWDAKVEYISELIEKAMKGSP